MRIGPCRRNWKNVRRRMDAYETDQTSNDRAKTLATTKRQDNGIKVNEMRMQRWMYGVTRKDNIWNEHIRWTTRVAQASNSKKITERMSNWYGHVTRRYEEYILKNTYWRASP